jgi:hypothetical protein
MSIVCFVLGFCLWGISGKDLSIIILGWEFMVLGILMVWYGKLTKWQYEAVCFIFCVLYLVSITPVAIALFNEPAAKFPYIIFDLIFGVFFYCFWMWTFYWCFYNVCRLIIHIWNRNKKKEIEPSYGPYNPPDD